MVLISISGDALPSPTKFNVSYQDIDGESTGRSESGYLTRTRIRTGVAKIELSFTMLTMEEVTNILNLIEPSSLNIKYWFGTEHEATMYAGDKSLELVHSLESGEVRWTLSFNLIEY